MRDTIMPSSRFKAGLIFRFYMDLKIPQLKLFQCISYVFLSYDFDWHRASAWMAIDLFSKRRLVNIKERLGPST